MNKNIILFGGKNIVLHFEPLADGTPVAEENVKVRQVPVREYEAGFPLINDESALVGFLCSKNKPWALTLTPDSHEEVLTTGREVNTKGFFSSCQRRTELEARREAKAQADMIGAMATLPPETVKLVMEKGMAAQAQFRLPILSPGFVSPPIR